MHFASYVTQRAFPLSDSDKKRNRVSLVSPFFEKPLLRYKFGKYKSNIP